ncbi:MAG: hypothetical protein AUJ48_01995 [Deltaproteobacteria bacterium CG1_02_45_11]|nr:MAG: hypothetical protein AUJ48_01995 [Deltaproteobacteria bacterium CG1_02_45_11]
MKDIWIIGGGQFGLKAAQELSCNTPEIDITAVDKDSNICKQLDMLSFRTVCGDGIKYLYDNLKGQDYPDWIVPAIPVHVAYEWIRSKLSVKYHFKARDVPDDLAQILPNPIRGDKGELYISNADFICPDNCPEPVAICTYTGEQRPGILHNVLESIHYHDFCSVVVRSRQLSLGVGGYPPKALFKAFFDITTSTTPVLLSTACRCHGVMHAFAISESK